MTTIMKNLSRPNSTYNDTNYKFIIITKAISNLNHVISNKLASIVSTISSKLSITGGTMQGDVDMSNKHITNLASPINSTDAVNKQYVDSRLREPLFLNKNTNDIDFRSLFEIAEALYLKFKDNSDIRFHNFKSYYVFALKVVVMHNQIFENADLNRTLERLNENTSIFDRMRYHVINIIECLVEGLFISVKEDLIRKRLIKTPESGTDHKKLRKLINRASRDISRDNQNVELLIQKNLLLLDLGFIYLNTELLEILAENVTI